MPRYRRNIDEKLRKLQREVFGGDLYSHANLIAERIRSGFITRESAEIAAYFNHPAALQALGMERIGFENFYTFLNTTNKNLTIRWVHCISALVLDIWHECMIQRSTESSEERALGAVSDGLRQIVEAPAAAVTGIQNWLLDGEDTEDLEGLCEFLSEISEEMGTIREAGESQQTHLWNSNDAANAAIESLAKAVCSASVSWNARTKTSGFYNGSRLCCYYAALCYRNAVKAIQLHRNVTVEVAGDEMHRTILNDMFTSL